MLASNLALAPTSPKWALLLFAQAAFYATALAGIVRPALLRHLPVRIASTFVRMNGYAVLGLFDFLRGRQTHLWTVTRPSDTVSP